MAKSNTVPHKSCIRCGKVLPLDAFPKNREWVTMSYRDAWCTECGKKYVVDRETVEQYCHDNNRQWKDAYWEACIKKAQYAVATDEAYLKANASRRTKLFNQAAAQAWLKMMNTPAYYGYIAYNDKPYEEIVAGESPEDQAAKEARRTYSTEWGGYYDDEEIQTMNDMYKEYERDFDLYNQSLIDYAHEVVKAKVYMNLMYSNMLRSKVTVKEYNAAVASFQSLSKDANFAACARRREDDNGVDSLGEIIEFIENHGMLNPEDFKGVQFPKDDIDAILQDYRHIERAVGAQL